MHVASVSFICRLGALLVACVVLGCSRSGFEVDAGLPDGVTGHCPSNPDLLLCDGFEAAEIGEVWIPNVAKGALELTSERARSGERSLRMSVNGLAAGEIGQAFLAESDVAPGAQDHAFLRGHYYIASPSNYTFVLWGFGQGVEPWKGVTLTLTPASELELISSAGDAPEYTTVGAIPTGQWICLEWDVDFVVGQVRLWLDGNELSGFDRVMPTKVDPLMVFFQFGPLLYYPPTDSTPIDIWVDDIALDDERIGCD